MWMASVYNYRAGDDFIVFGETKQKAIDNMVNAYSNWYVMDDEDVKDLYGYKTMEEYLKEERELTLTEVKTGVVNINKEWRDINTTELLKEEN